jgi:glyceraldehyde-3-phosphate dehydrogenase (NADP+)
VEPQSLYIGGAWRETGRVVAIINPYSGKPAGHIHLGGESEMDEAIAAAFAARGPLAALTNATRATALDRVRGNLLARREEIARTLTAESGKPIRDARLEVDRAAHTFQIAAEEARRFGTGEMIPLDRVESSAGRYGITRRFPIGVVGAITPFNFPINLVAHKVAPALASGNPVVLKPAHQTPLTAFLLAESIHNAGLPPGSFNVVHSEPAAGSRLATDERVAILSFTGSGRVGWELKARAPRKKVILELGGNAAVIVDATADPVEAAKRCAAGAFAYAGQICISVQRILVHEEIARAFEEAFLMAVYSLTVGDPLNESTDVGPMISEDAARRVEEWVREAVDAGARIVAGEGEAEGQFFRPTVLADVPPQCRVEKEEVFGPVATLARFSDFDEALDRVNASDFGLQAGLFTESLAHAQRAFARLEVGAVIVNDVPTYRVDHMPYGGVKGSGFGREGVRYTMEEMSEPRLLVLKGE